MDMGYLNCGDLQKHIKKRGKEELTIDEILSKKPTRSYG